MNGRTVNLFVAIAYGKSAAMCEQSLGKYNGDSYSKFVRKYVPATFVKANNSQVKLFLQNCNELHKAYSKIDCRIAPVPARSTENNPVENVFNNVGSKLRTDTWKQEIKYEPYEKRACSTLLNFSTEIIGRTIESMPNRMNLILAGKGHRTNY